jgi:hypothetical protein
LADMMHDEPLDAGIGNSTAADRCVLLCAPPLLRTGGLGGAC